MSFNAMSLIEININSKKLSKLLKGITNKLNQIIMTNAELVALLQADEAKVDKIITEIQALQALVTSTANVPQEVIDAVNSLGAKLQVADDLNPDA